MTVEPVRTEKLDLLGHGWWDVRSANHVYRYEIGHRFGPGYLVGFTGINPSTAIAGEPDATTRKWDGFARRWGFGGWVAVNPYALCSTDVRALLKHPDPIGPRNDEMIVRALDPAIEVVCCWGNPPSGKLVPRLLATARLLATLGKPLRCVGRTQLGQPRHLLMEAYATPREVFVP